MRLVVYGPNRRLGAVEGDRVVDLNAACAAYLASRGERLALEMAAATVPDELGAFIEAGDRGVEGAMRAVEFVTRATRPGRAGERLMEALWERKATCALCAAGSDHDGGRQLRDSQPGHVLSQ